MDHEHLKIGMICPGYPSGEPGDYRGIFVHQMVQALKARGHRVCVVTSRIRPQDLNYQRIDGGEEVHRFPFWSEGKLLIEYPRVPVARMLTYMASALWHGRRVFSRFGCDLIHSHFLLPTGLIGAALAGALRRPHVATVHGSDVRLASGKAVMRPLARWTLRRCAAVTAQARHQTAPLLGLGLNPAQLTTMPMGIDEVFLSNPYLENPQSAIRNPQSAEAGVDARAASEERTRASALPVTVQSEDAGAASIISTRTLREEIYNIPQLLRAMQIVAARNPAAHCTLAGDGPDRPRLEALARELGLEKCVTFSGWASPERLARELRRHRVYVSTSRVDGASVSLFEALASGAFPVVSDIAANREWIRDGENGRLFPLDDPAALAAALLEALADPMADAGWMRQAVAMNLQTAQATFSWEAIAVRLERIYAQAIK